MPAAIPSPTRTLIYALAAFLIALPAMIGLFRWAT
jgi:hypothetical protein